MSHGPDDIPYHPLLAVIEDTEPGSMTLDEWLASLAGDEPTDVDADAAEILREMRDHGER